VLALDHCFNVVALPSVLDAGERATLLSALRPCARLQAKLDRFISSVSRPVLATHVRRTDHWRLAKLFGDKRFWPDISEFTEQIQEQLTKRRLASWLLCTDCDAPAEVAALRAVPGFVDSASLFLTEEGCNEDGVACAVLDLWLAASADFFMGTCGSMFSDFIERFRVAEGRVVDHLFFNQSGAGAPAAPHATADSTAEAGVEAASAAAQPNPTAVTAVTDDGSLDALLTKRAAAVASAKAEKAALLSAAATGGDARSGAVLGLMCHKLPPELRAKVLAFHPQAEAMPQTISLTSRELFDAFIEDKLPPLRASPLKVAPRGTTDKVALLIEPRCHYALEHVVRNAMYFLAEPGGETSWQLQIFHGTENEAFIRAAFSHAELEHIQLVSLEVDNLSNLAHNELMCTHWLWNRAAAERVLIFQTDSLICRRGIEAFQRYDYIGAPWRTDDLWCVGKPWLMESGNGGFSLRSRTVTLACLDVHGYCRGQCEDVFYAENIPKVGGLIAPRAEALRFSVESVVAPRPFGFHAAYKWLHSTDMAELLNGISYA